MKKDKKDLIEYLGFEDDTPRKVGRPKLADKETKKKSLIIACCSFFAVIMLLVFGYGTLFGFNNKKLVASTTNKNTGERILIDEIKPLIKDITIKKDTKRKIYVTILPNSATNKKLSYKSSNPGVASVDNNGIVTGLKEGNSVITVKTLDGTDLQTKFNIDVIKNASGICSIETFTKKNDGIYYDITCDNATIKEVQYKIGNGDYEKLLSKKNSGSAKFSDTQLKKDITLKVVYYPNNSKITDYETRTIKASNKTTQEVNGSCKVSINHINANSCKYDITCDNATVSKIAYKIGNGSYIGIDNSNLADTILFEESDVTRQFYLGVEYVIDGTNKHKTVTKSSIIEKGKAKDNSTEIEVE